MSDQEWTNSATVAAWIFLTNEQQTKKTKKWVEQKLRVAMSGRVKLMKSGPIKFGPDGANLSRTARSILATGLSLSFGADAPDEVYDTDTWAGNLACCVALTIDWDQLADRLLRHYTLEYVPSDAEDDEVEHDERDADDRA